MSHGYWLKAIVVRVVSNELDMDRESERAWKNDVSETKN